ncbi:hypothetical protein SCP_0803620 [Sparassis crispa]|uniref:F-box domain-containing protein n=1 Tax=Sparassis crispa TaxID=139825 RepID=A0A401GUH8_9APHY|nr:hypothetical protein SCP_0803620 [Sparassis crispa]GBE85840.1 hypothetical protein SCP_0803620 [Sparassis crispa]
MPNLLWGTVPTVPPVILYILPHAHRIRSLRWLGLSRSEMQILLSNLIFAAPSLETLELSCSHHGKRDDLLFAPAENQFPRIRSISLSGIFIPLSLSMFRGLVSLQLGHLNSSHTPSMDMLLDVLEACPDLHVLSITHPPRKSAQNWHSNSIVSLPRLSQLGILNMSPDMPRLLDYLRISAQTCVDIRGQSTLAMSDEEACAPFLFSGRTRLPNLTDVTDVAISLSTLLSFDLELTATAASAQKLRVRLAYTQFSRSAPSKGASTVYRAFAQLFGSSPVRSLCTSGMGGTVDTWRDTLRSFPLLQRLHVQFIGAEEAVSLLRCLAGEAEEELVCPELVHLGLPNHLDPQLLAAVVVCLDRRAARGCRLGTFSWRILNGSRQRFRLKMETIEMIKRKVEVFECDASEARRSVSAAILL